MIQFELQIGFFDLSDLKCGLEVSLDSLEVSFSGLKGGSLVCISVSGGLWRFGAVCVGLNYFRVNLWFHSV